MLVLAGLSYTFAVTIAVHNDHQQVVLTANSILDVEFSDAS
jgi:hypothetical protein